MPAFLRVVSADLTRPGGPDIQARSSRSPHWGKVRGLVTYAAGPVFGLATGPVLAHTLGPVGRGQFSGVMEPITIAAAVAAIGVPTAVTYYVASRRGPRRVIWRRGASIVAVTSLLVFAAMVFYSSAVAEATGLPRWTVIAAWSFTVPAAIVQVRRGYWQGLGTWGLLDTERFSFAALRLVAVLACAVLGATSSSVYIGAALLAFAAAALLLWPPRRQHYEDSEPGQLPPFKQMLNYSILTSLGSIAVVSNNRLDQALMPAQTTPAELGLYAVAVTVAEIPLVFSALAARDILQLGSAQSSLNAIFSQVGLYVTAFVTGTIAMAVLSPWLLPLVFGQAFAAAVPSILWLAVSTFCGGCAWMLGNFLSSIGRPGSSALIPLTGMIVTVALFVLEWGRVDALRAAQISAATQFASLVVGVVLAAIIAKRSRVHRR